MAKSSKTARGSQKVVVATKSSARTLPLARRGVKTGNDFAGMMSALMSDLPEGKITPQIANAMCNAGGKLLKVVELQAKYGTPASGKQAGRQLVLTAAAQ